MKLMVDARTLGSRPSGIGIYIHSFLKELVKHKEIQLLIISDVAESEELQWFTNQKLQVITLGHRVFRTRGIFEYFAFVKQQLLLTQPDILWEPNNLLPYHMRGYKGKIIITLQDLFPVTMPQCFPLIYRLYFRWGFRKTLKYTAGVVYTSNETKTIAEKWAPYLAQKRSVNTGIIVDNEIIPCQGEDYFLYIGNLETRKGVDLLLKAYQAYWNQGGTRPLYLAGRINGKVIDDLIRQMTDRCPGFTYFGYVDLKKKEELLRNCGCFVFPSRGEGFGIPPLEAMGYGKPIIVSDLSIFSEILDGCGKSFSLAGSEAQQVQALCEAMCQPPEPDLAHYQQVLNKYSGPVLTGQLIEFMQQLMN